MLKTTKRKRLKQFIVKGTIKVLNIVEKHVFESVDTHKSIWQNRWN